MQLRIAQLVDALISRLFHTDREKREIKELQN